MPKGAGKHSQRILAPADSPVLLRVWELQLLPPKDMLQALPAWISLQLQGATLQGQAGFWDGGEGYPWQKALEFLLIPSWMVPMVPEGDKC